MTPAPPEGDLEQGGNPVANPSGLCKCGCGQRTNLAKQTNTRHGHRKGEPLDWIQGHNNVRYHYGHIEVDRGYETPCHIWTGRRFASGYGRLRTHELAHRVAYVSAYGPIPDGHHVHHRCKQRDCIRPEHLMACTIPEHKREHSTLTYAIVDEIRRATGTTNRVLAARYGISEGHVSTIRRGLSWS
jgi:hypothetical protein